MRGSQVPVFGLLLVEDPQLRAELAPDEFEAFDTMVVQQRRTVDAMRDFIFPAINWADHAFLEGLDRPENLNVDQLSEPFPAPALFLMGRQDSVVGYRGAWNLIENYQHATFAVLDRAGHFLGDEQERLFKALVNE